MSETSSERRPFRFGPEGLARAASRHPVRTILIWLALVAIMVVLAFFFLGDVLTQEFTFSDRPESVQAAELLDEKFPDRAEDSESVFNWSTRSRPPFKILPSLIGSRPCKELSSDWGLRLIGLDGDGHPLATPAGSGTP